MRINVYAEEMTERVEIVEKVIDGDCFTGVRFYLELPVTVSEGWPPTHRSVAGKNVVAMDGKVAQVAGPFIHRPGDDDSSAVTFWGKTKLRAALQSALSLLDAYDAGREDRKVTS